MKRIVVYSHDAYGLGNIRRMLEVVSHLVLAYPELRVLLITGSPLIHAFRIPPRVDYIKLPCVARNKIGQPVVKTLDVSYADIVHLRTDVIMTAVRDFDPDLILVDKKPLGIGKELEPLLARLHNTPRRPKMALLLRDILDEPASTIREWQSGGYHDAIERYYDRILVAGDRAIFDLAREYRFPPSAEHKLRYCGYMGRALPTTPPTQVRASFGIDGTPLVLVTAGGGDDGGELMTAYLRGLATHSQAGFTSLLVTGPESSPATACTVQTLASGRRDVIVRDFCDDMMDVMNCADLVVSMCGYNTACELLSLHKNAVVVPRVKPVREQWIRAERLQACGLLHALHPNRLSPRRLMSAVIHELSRDSARGPARHDPEMDGLSRIGAAITELLETDKPAPPALHASADAVATPLLEETPARTLTQRYAGAIKREAALPDHDMVRFMLRLTNRHGVGHLMRGLNICRELVAMGIPGRILFYGRAAPPPQLWDPRFEFRVEGEAKRYHDWPEAMRSAKPAVVVYDTSLPAEDVWPHEPEGSRRAYIMRRWMDTRLAELLGHGLLRHIDAVIVPHTQEEFGHELPGWLRQRAFFVGPIVRRPDPLAQEKLRHRYALAPGDFVVTSTCGGGGFPEQAKVFFAAVWAIHDLITQEKANLRHIVVRGPNGTEMPTPLPGMTLVDTEPDLVSLLAISDLAIAEGGYNTVNEIRITRTPALFLPSPRNKDDQNQRVRQLEARGLAWVCGPTEHRLAAAMALALCRDTDALQAMRRAYASDTPEIGNRRAAEILVELTR